jgi:hypothetical protein
MILIDNMEIRVYTFRRSLSTLLSDNRVRQLKIGEVVVQPRSGERK